MKKNKIIIGAVSLALAVSVQTAFADAKGFYNADSRTVNVKNAIENPEYPFANIMVFPADVKREEITEDSFVFGEVLHKMVYTTGGNINESIKLNNEFKKGEYVLYVECGQFSDMSAFIVSDENLSSAVKDVNNSKKLADVTFGADKEFFAKNKDAINLLIKNAKPRSGYTNNSFADEYMRSAAVISLGSGDIAFDEFIDLYELYFDFENILPSDTDDDFSNGFVSALSEYDIGLCSAQQVVSGAVFVADAKAQTEQNKLVEVMQKYIADNDLSEGKYSKLNTLYASKARSKFKDAIISLNSAQKIYDKYIQICDELYDDQNENNSGGGGGGGSSSGRGSGGGVSLPVVSDTTQIPDISDDATFSDVSGHWSEAYVKECVKSGIINGYSDNTFRPDNKITRVETATLITKLFKFSSQDVDFTDVSKTDWFYEGVGAAYSAGVVKGYDDGKFRPFDNITRQDMALMLCRAMESNGFVFKGNAEFSDKNLISDYAYDSVLKLAAEGIITGDNGKFRPLDKLTRAEAAALMCRIKNIYSGGES